MNIKRKINTVPNQKVVIISPMVDDTSDRYGIITRRAEIIAGRLSHTDGDGGI